MLHYFTMLHHVKISNIIPIASFIVSCCSFRYQITVLYPWHEDLSKQMLKLEYTMNTLKNEITLNEMKKSTMFEEGKKKND